MCDLAVERLQTRWRRWCGLWYKRGVYLICVQAPDKAILWVLLSPIAHRTSNNCQWYYSSLPVHHQYFDSYNLDILISDTNSLLNNWIRMIQKFIFCSGSIRLTDVICLGRHRYLSFVPQISYASPFYPNFLCTKPRGARYISELI